MEPHQEFRVYLNTHHPDHSEEADSQAVLGAHPSDTALYPTPTRGVPSGDPANQPASGGKRTAQAGMSSARS